MQVHLLGWSIDIDREATITAYKQWRPPPAESTHPFNRNYIATFDRLPAEFAEILQTLGIDFTKPSDVYEVCDNGDDTHMFMGWYHVVGRRIAESNNGVSQASFQVDKFGWHQIAGNCKAKLTNESYLLPESFLGEVLQVNFSVNIPWIVKESL